MHQNNIPILCVNLYRISDICACSGPSKILNFITGYRLHEKKSALSLYVTTNPENDVMAKIIFVVNDTVHDNECTNNNEDKISLKIYAMLTENVLQIFSPRYSEYKKIISPK